MSAIISEIFPFKILEGRLATHFEIFYDANAWRLL